MLKYEKIDVSEGIDINKTSAWKECELCSDWFFKDVGFTFEENVCNKCHDLLTMAHSLKNIAILSAKGNTFRWLLRGISENKALKRLNNSITYDRRVLQKRYFFSLYIKISENTDLTYYQKSQNVILNKAKDYYKNNKERLKEQARDKYRCLSEEEKNIKREYGGRIGIIICLKKRNND